MIDVPFLSLYIYIFLFQQINYARFIFSQNSSALKDLLTKMWADALPDVRKLFEKKEAEDKAR